MKEDPINKLHPIKDKSRICMKNNSKKSMIYRTKKSLFFFFIFFFWQLENMNTSALKAVMIRINQMCIYGGICYFQRQ